MWSKKLNIITEDSDFLFKNKIGQVIGTLSGLYSFLMGYGECFQMFNPPIKVRGAK